MTRNALNVGIVVMLGALIAGIVSLSGPSPREDRRFHGVWLDGFETAAFFEGAKEEDLPQLRMPGNGWLSFEEGQFPADIIDTNSMEVSFFEMSFEGRKVQGPSGHLDQYPAEYFVESIVSLERFVPDLRALTEYQADPQD